MRWRVKPKTWKTSWAAGSNWGCIKCAIPTAPDLSTASCWLGCGWLPQEAGRRRQSSLSQKQSRKHGRSRAVATSLMTKFHFSTSRVALVIDGGLRAFGAVTCDRATETQNSADDQKVRKRLSYMCASSGKLSTACMLAGTH